MKAADLFDLTGQVALVTGASSGLGHRFARVLAANGAKVVCAARRLDRLLDLAAEIEASGGHATAVRMDVGETDSIVDALEAAEAAFGPVTVLVNNAGRATPANALDVSDAAWHGDISVNLDGVFRVARETARRMVATGTGGSIINTASILGLRPTRGLAAYCASKAAVVQLTGALAIEWGRYAIRVNGIAPGYFSTEMNVGYLESAAGRSMLKAVPLGRHGDEGELDGALLLLSSSAGSYITGAVLPVDGGHVLGVSS